MKIKILLLMLILLIPQVLASYAPYYSNSFGQNTQYYTVNFDNEGEASVLARLNFHNIQIIPLDTIKLEIPGNNIRIINVVQEYYSYNNVCVRYDYNSIIVPLQETNVQTLPATQYKCLEYQKRKDYTPKYSIIKYEQEVTSSSILLKLNLPNQINSEESSQIIVYYKAKDYTIKESGVYKYNFETIKTYYDTEQVKVGINVNQGLYLEEGNTKVQYLNNNLMPVLTKQSLSSSESSILSSNINYIGDGSYVKTATALDPLESFRVKGEYSDSWVALNKGKVAIYALIVLILLMGIIFGIIKAIKVLRKGNENSKAIITGFVAATINVGLWTLFVILLGQMNRYYYQYGIFILLIGIMLGLLTLALLFGPAIYFGIKYKPVQSLNYIVAFIGTAIILAMIILFLFSYMYKPKYYPYPYSVY